MFSHVKETIQPVKVDTPDPIWPVSPRAIRRSDRRTDCRLQYWVQSFHVEDAAIRDMLQDISLEEFSHLEMVGKLIAQHTRNLDQTDVYAAPLFAVKGVRTAFSG